MPAKETNLLPLRVKFGYGVGALSYGIPFQMISGYFIFFSTAVLGISGSLAGIIFAVSIIWDAFTDPVMGYISDQTRKSILFGRRLFYVMLGAIGMAIANYFLWTIDKELPYFAKAALLGLLLLLIKTFATVLTTPYLALGAELSTDYNERTSVQSFRTAFFFLGFLFPTVIGLAIFFRPTPEFANGQMNPAAYTAIGFTTSIIILAAAAISIFFTRGKSQNPAIVKTKKSSIANMFKEAGTALKCSDFRNIGLGLLFTNMAMGIVGAIGLHTFTYTFGFSNSQIALVFGALFVAALIAQPVWVAVAKKFEKRTALISCLYINIAITSVFLGYVFINDWVADNYLIMLPVSILMGFSMGGSIALPYSMISDTIDKDAFNTGVRKEGVFYGCATFMYKLSQSLSVLLIGFLLDIIRFDSGLEQTRDIYIKLGLIMPVGTLICFILTLYFVKKYTLNQQIVSEYQKYIK